MTKAIKRERDNSQMVRGWVGELLNCHLREWVGDRHVVILASACEDLYVNIYIYKT